MTASTIYRPRTTGSEVQLRLLGSLNGLLKTPDSAVFAITDDLTADWFGSVDNPYDNDQAVFGQWSTVSNQRSWGTRVALTADGKPGVVFWTSTSGSTSASSTITAIPIKSGMLFGLRATRRRSDGLTKVYFSLTDPPSWQLVSTDTISSGQALFASTADVMVGGIGASAGTGSMHTGYFRRAALYNGFDGAGTLIAAPDATIQTPAATSFNDAQANPWTVGGSAVIVTRPPIQDVQEKELWAEGKRVWPLSSGGLRAVDTTQANSVMCPDQSSFGVDDLDVRWFGRYVNWGVASSAAFAQWATGGNQRGWLVETGSRQVRISISTDGSNQFSSNLINIPYTDGQPGGFRVTRVKSTGVTTMWFSNDGITWTPWTAATAILSAGNAPFHGTAPIVAGAYGAAGASAPIPGDTYYAELRDGIDGNVVFRVGAESFRRLTRDQASWTCETGQTVTRVFHVNNTQGVYPTVTTRDHINIYDGDRRRWPGADGYISFDGSTGTDLVVSPEEVYLIPVIGMASTPDPGVLPTQFVFVMKVRGPNAGGTAGHDLFGQYDGGSDNSWRMERLPTVAGATSGELGFWINPTGSTSGNGLGANKTTQAVTNADEWLAMAVQWGTGSYAQSYISTDGVTWTLTEGGAPAGNYAQWDSSLPVTIGGLPSTGGMATRFRGRVYSVEMHKGFDPNALGSVTYSDDFNRVSDAVVAYNFTETGQSATDRSGSGNHGVLQNNTTPTDLHSSGELRLNSANYNLQYTPSVYPTAASVSMRIRCPAGVWGRGSFWSYMNANDTSGFNLCTTEAVNGSVYGIVRGASGVAVINSGSGVLVQGGTVTLALTYDGTTTRLYKDGTEIATSTSASGNLNLTAGKTFRIGYNPDNPLAGYAEFYADDVRFFHRALSAAEVASLVNNPVTIEGPGAGAGWLHDSGAFTISNNRLTRPSATGGSDHATFNQDLGSPDHWVEANIYSGGEANGGAGAAYVCIQCRTGPSYGQSAYLGYYNPGMNKMWFGKMVGGSFIDISGPVSTTSYPAQGAKLRFEVSGSTLSLYLDGVLQHQITDTSITTGNYVGVNTNSAGPPTQYDNFTAGTGSLMWKFDAKEYLKATRTAGCLVGGSGIGGAISDFTGYTINTDVVMTVRASFVASTGTQYMVSDWGTTTSSESFSFQMSSSEAIQFAFQDAATPGTVSTIELLSTAEFAALGVLGTGAYVDLGVKFELNSGGSYRLVALRSTDGGSTWNEIGTAKTGTALTAVRTVTSPICVGCSPSGAFTWTAGAKIAKAEIRTGTDPNGGTLIMRFDTADYPVATSPTTWTDARGKTWTIPHMQFVGDISYADPRGRTWTLGRNGAIEGKLHNTGNVGSAEVVVRPHTTWANVKTMVAKWGDPGKRCWQFQISSTTGKVQFVYSWTGSADEAGWSYTETTSALSFPTTEWVRLKVTWNGATGAVVFYGALEGEQLQVLDTKSRTPWTMYQGDAPITIGSIGQTTNHSDSDIRYVSVRDGAGVEVFGMDRDSFKIGKRATTIGSRSCERAYLDVYNTSRPSTPKPAVLPDEIIFVYCFSHIGYSGTSGFRYLASQGASTVSDRGFKFGLPAASSTTHAITTGRWDHYPLGTSSGPYAASPSWSPYIYTSKPQTRAFCINVGNVSIPCWVFENGTWTQVSGSGGTGVLFFDSTSPILIGDDGTNTSATWFDGHIYWIEMRSGMHPERGKVLWRFDASEYPGGGVSTWTDQRGNVWTLTGSFISKTIVPMVGDITLRGAAKIYPTVSEMKARWNVSQWGDGTKWSP